MEIRQVVDNTELTNLHAQMGLDYTLDLTRGDFIVKHGLYDDNRLVVAVLGRATTEAYLLMDKKWSNPSGRWDAIKRVSAVSMAEARDFYGIRDVHVWVPPRVCFKRRLKQMGFVPAPWECMVGQL